LILIDFLACVLSPGVKDGYSPIKEVDITKKKGIKPVLKKSNSVVLTNDQNQEEKKRSFYCTYQIGSQCAASVIELIQLINQLDLLIDSLD
jgi:hypothetical protein